MSMDLQQDDAAAMKVETAGGLLEFVRRWGDFSGSIYHPLTAYEPGDSHVHCLVRDGRVLSHRHVGHPDVFTFVSYSRETLAHVADPGFEPFALSGAQVEAFLGATNVVLLDGAWPRVRRWMVRSWEETPSLWRPFGVPFPTAVVADWADTVMGRVVLQRSGEEGDYLGMVTYRGAECVVLRDKPVAVGAGQEGGLYGMAYPSHVLEAQARGCAVVLMGSLLAADPFDIWALYPG